MQKRHRPSKRHHFAGLLAGSLLALVLIDISVGASDDPATILRQLRTEQRQYVIEASRDGLPRVIAYEPPARAVAIRPVGAGEAAPSRERSAVLPRPPIAYVPRPAPSTSDRLIGGGRSFIPTTSSAKPSAHPAPPLGGHDLAWIYAHRFETPSPNEVQVPGVPIRSQVASPFDIRSGAFHGVRAVNGWSAVRAQVSIPCGVAHFTQGYGYNEVTRQYGMVDQETGFIYIGGWGAGSKGAPVDAGLQKASAQATRDDYAFYFKYANNKPITSEIRFPCGGPNVEMELYPVSTSLLVFSVTGLTDQHRRMTLTLVQHTRQEDGWIPDGGSNSDGIILKRIVAIAQPPSWRRLWGIFHLDRFADGSYFGVSGSSDTNPKLKWLSCEIGRVVPPSISPHYRPWTSAETWAPATPGVYTDWPPADVVRNPNGMCDAVGIALRK